jgi:hypothetical protein
MQSLAREHKKRHAEVKLARVNFLGRITLRQFHVRLASTPVTTWPEPLADAWQILTRKLRLAPSNALGVTLASAAAARACIRAQRRFEQPPPAAATPPSPEADQAAV